MWQVSDMLAVGCEGGVCLWTLTHASSSGVHGNVGVGAIGIASQGYGLSTRRQNRSSVIIASAWARFLSTNARISSTSWSPSGHMLAAASSQSPTIWIWDIATVRAKP